MTSDASIHLAHENFTPAVKSFVLCFSGSICSISIAFVSYERVAPSYKLKTYLNIWAPALKQTVITCAQLPLV